MSKIPELPYNPENLARELKRHYISASESDISSMLEFLGKKSFADLFSHIPDNVKMDQEPALPEELEYRELQKHMFELSEKNNPKLSFLGDGLSQFRVAEIVPHVLSIRKLTTAYTPYQPERSQGTLATHWIYQSALSAITNFEAVNASLYDRSTALFEAIKTAQRLQRGSNVALVAGNIYPGDLEVLHTLAQETDLDIVEVPFDKETGAISLEQLRDTAAKQTKKIACFAFTQVNNLGVLENVDALTDYCAEVGVKSITIIDPILEAEGGLKSPRYFGQNGANMFVAEGQHLAIDANFGGPGLGIFGIRFEAKNKNDIRSTAGRYVGRAEDIDGKPAFAMVLSTREQHIRRDKATSNICSNQAYIATVAGAALLERGAEGLKEACTKARDNAVYTAKRLLSIPGIELSFPRSAFFHELNLKLSSDVKMLIHKASQAGIHIGVDISERMQAENRLLVSFSDCQSQADCDRLVQFFAQEFGAAENADSSIPEIPNNYLRTNTVEIPKIPVAELKKYYTALGEQNVSPDQNIYALGSCTMKYNPYINDYAAALNGFAAIHPQAPLEDAQGSLEIIYQTQEYFKAICGLEAVTTQPVAGAQGELVGLKMFQAYHRDRNDLNRNVVLIPKSAHGTNPATATMAGFLTKRIEGLQCGVVEINADSVGQMDMLHLDQLIAEYGERICGVMVTNPNTSGIFEDNFKIMADKIHTVGGLVYMDGANMNAIAGWVDLGKLGVDAVHNNTHKTWTIPHGGGGPGDAFVAVSEKLIDFLPGQQVCLENGIFSVFSPKKTIGSFHRHFGNMGHKVRCYTYLRALGKAGIRRMSAIAVLSATYLYKKLYPTYPTLPLGAENHARMHEFILTLSKDHFAKIEASGLAKAMIIPRIGKLFLDFGLHAPTVAFPEQYGLMVEPTESYTKAELDRFSDIVLKIFQLISEKPEVLQTVPHFTPIARIDEVKANKDLQLHEVLKGLPKVLENKLDAEYLNDCSVEEISKKIIAAHEQIS